ncbi:MAG: glycosyltransferase [Clostridia bacterium]|nr:glycosyltransferase [Clostridia bacterium]
MNDKKKILIATAFPTHGAGSGALVTTQSKSYEEVGHEVVIITGNNRTDFDKLDGVRYHVVPFTAESDNPEKIDGQVPFNYLMFTTHTESTANFWNIGLGELEEYCKAFKSALSEEVENFNPDVIHAQHNWLLSSSATEMGKPVVTTIHGTDLMGYEKSKQKLSEVLHKLDVIKKSEKISLNDLNKIEEIYNRSNSYSEITRELDALLSSNDFSISENLLNELKSIYDEKKKYEFYISEAEKSARNSEKIIVISDAQKEKFSSLFPFAEDKVELLENGYDPKTFYVNKNVNKEEVFASLTSDRTRDGKIRTDYDKLILFVGKFADFKGIDSLLSAAKMYEFSLIEQHLKPLTIIVGSGALESKLKAQADELNLRNVHFVGRQPHDVICNLQNLADVSVIPSRNEPFGLVVIEGTACGHPVIGSNSGGIPGILNTKKEKLPDDDIIKTDLGVLIRPLPERPSRLPDPQKDILDKYTSKYLVYDIDVKESILSRASNELAVSVSDLNDYFEDYGESTRALSNSVVKICTGEFKFDNNKIAEYTKTNYEQPVIREKLIGIFDDAINIHNQKNK